MLTIAASGFITFLQLVRDRSGYGSLLTEHLQLKCEKAHTGQYGLIMNLRGIQEPKLRGYLKIDSSVVISTQAVNGWIELMSITSRSTLACTHNAWYKDYRDTYKCRIYEVDSSIHCSCSSRDDVDNRLDALHTVGD
jgi:hypothetical protein